jgi:hypothetical protein
LAGGCDRSLTTGISALWFWKGDYERLATIIAGYRWVAFVILMLQPLFRKSI